MIISKAYNSRLQPSNQGRSAQIRMHCNMRGCSSLSAGLHVHSGLLPQIPDPQASSLNYHTVFLQNYNNMALLRGDYL